MWFPVLQFVKSSTSGTYVVAVIMLYSFSQSWDGKHAYNKCHPSGSGSQSIIFIPYDDLFQPGHSSSSYKEHRPFYMLSYNALLRIS